MWHVLRSFYFTIVSLFELRSQYAYAYQYSWCSLSDFHCIIIVGHCCLNEMVFCLYRHYSGKKVVLDDFARHLLLQRKFIDSSTLIYVIFYEMSVFLPLFLFLINELELSDVIWHITTSFPIHLRYQQLLE